MVKLVVTYGAPQDPDAFESHYGTTHAELVAKLPNLRRFEAALAVATPDGSDLPCYRIAELWYDNQDDLQASLGSPEGQAAVADIPNFASGGAQTFVAAVD